MGIVGQSALITLMGERRSLGALGSPCSGVRGAPLSQMEEAVVEDGAVRGGDGGASQAVGRDGKPHQSPKTAPASRRKRPEDRVWHARSTTTDGRHVRRRGALFSGESDAAGDDGSSAPAHTRPDVPQQISTVPRKCSMVLGAAAWPVD